MSSVFQWDPNFNPWPSHDCLPNLVIHQRLCLKCEMALEVYDGNVSLAIFDLLLDPLQWTWNEMKNCRNASGRCIVYLFFSPPKSESTIEMTPVRTLPG